LSAAAFIFVINCFDCEVSQQTGMHLENCKPLLQQDCGDFLALNNDKVTLSSSSWCQSCEFCLKPPRRTFTQQSKLIVFNFRRFRDVTQLIGFMTVETVFLSVFQTEVAAYCILAW